MTDSSQIDAAKSDTPPTLALPQPREYAVGTTDYSFIDLERAETYTDDPDDKREITAKVWYPSEEVPEADTAPYLGEQYSQAIALSQEIPPQDFARIVESVATNSVTEILTILLFCHLS